MDSDAHRERARLLLQTHRPALAEVELRAALALDPENAGILSELAWCLLRCERANDALQTARAAIEADPTLYSGHMVAATACNILERRAEALRSIRVALELASDEPAVHAEHARINMGLKRWPVCLSACERALALDPHLGWVHGMRTVALTRLGRSAEAMSAAREALALAPEHKFSHTASGLANLEAGDAAAATVAFREALRVDPNDGCAQSLLLLSMQQDSSLMLRLGKELSDHLIGLMVFGLPVFLALFTVWHRDASTILRGLGFFAAIALLAPVFFPAFTNVCLLFQTTGRRLLKFRLIACSLVIVGTALTALTMAVIGLSVGIPLAPALALGLAILPGLLCIIPGPFHLHLIAALVFGLALISGLVAAFYRAPHWQADLYLVAHCWGMLVCFYAGTGVLRRHQDWDDEAARKPLYIRKRRRH